MVSDPSEADQRRSRLIGIAWMVGSLGCFTGSMLIVRGLSDELHVFEMVFFRALFGVSVMLPWLARAGLGVLRTRRIRLYMLRSTLAATNLCCMFVAISLMPVADVTAILFTRPMLITILAIYLLGELAGRRQWIALMVGFAGALPMIQPGFDTINPGALLALGAALLTAVLYNIAKILTRTETADTIAFYHAFLMLPVATLPALFVWQTPTIGQLSWLFGIGALTTLSHRTMNRAYARCDLTLLAPLEFLRLPFAALLEFFLFGDIPGPWVWLGGSIIFGASLYGTRPSGPAQVPVAPEPPPA